MKRNPRFIAISINSRFDSEKLLKKRTEGKKPRNGVRRVRFAPVGDLPRHPVLLMLPRGQAKWQRRRPRRCSTGAQHGQWNSDAAIGAWVSSSATATGGISSAPATELPFSFSSESYRPPHQATTRHELLVNFL